MDTVALFTSCMADLAAPGPARAAREVLTAMGWRVEVPARQTCCGQPALNTGFPEEAGMVLASWARTFADYRYVVAVAGSCAAMVDHHGPDLLPGRLLGRLGQVVDFSRFVADHGTDLDLALDARVTYHDSCHLTRVIGERTAPRDVLGRIRGLRLVEMTDADACCGFGGTFSVKFPEVSTTMADMKLASVPAGVDAIVSADPGCLLHLGARARGQGPRFLHLAEIVAAALPGAARRLP